MGRIRTVKPELLRHEWLYQSEMDTGLPLRVAFVGLFTACDREGRFVWSPRALKLDALPYDDVDFSRVLDALLTRGFIAQYEINGKLYGCIPTWSKHQAINNKESASNIPAPPEDILQAFENNGDLTRDSRVDDATYTPLGKEQGEGKGKEGKGRGKGREGASSDAAPLPDWLPLDAWRGYLDMRKKKNKSPTQRAVGLVLAELKKIHDCGYDVGAVLDKSTANNWTDVYMPKEANIRGSPGPAQLGKAGQATARNAQSWLEAEGANE